MPVKVCNIRAAADAKECVREIRSLLMRPFASTNRAAQAGKMPLRRNVSCTSAWGPPSPRGVTRLRGIFRDGNGLLRTVFAANSHINTSISHVNANIRKLALAGGAGRGAPAAAQARQP